MNGWYYRKGDKQFGPISLDEIRQLVRTNELQASDMVSEDNGVSWKMAGEVVGLFAPPPFPPISSGNPIPTPESGSPVSSASFTASSPVQRFLGQDDPAKQVFGIMFALFGLCVMGLILWLCRDKSPPTAATSPTPAAGERGLVSRFFDYFSNATVDTDFQKRDFGDNPSKYKGKTLTWKVTDMGKGGLGGWQENGSFAIHVGEPFHVVGIVHGSLFSFDMYIDIPAGFKAPPIRPGEDAIVTFKCTEGSLASGNIAVEITRP